MARYPDLACKEGDGREDFLVSVSLSAMGEK